MIKPRLLATMLLLSGSGCGLVNELENFKGINFQLPQRTYSVSTDDPRWHAPPSVPLVTCGPSGIVVDCCKPPAPLPAIDCVAIPLICDAGSCAFKFSYEEKQEINLAKDVPSLSNSKGQIFSEMALKSIDVTIDMNTLNVTLPPVGIYLAPSNVVSASNPAAKLVATVAMKTAGFTGKETVPLDDASQKVFSTFANDFQTPFNIIVATTVVYKSGDTVVPKGKINFAVGGKIAAKF